MISSGGIRLGTGAKGTFGVKGMNPDWKSRGPETITFDSWRQGKNGTLRFQVDGDNVTPIEVAGNVRFAEGAKLDVSLEGTPPAPFDKRWDIMTWEGDLKNADLRLAEDVNTDVWSMEWVDTDDSGEADTLRIHARGKAKRISSLEELAHYASESGNTVRMKPGTYEISDYMPFYHIWKMKEEGKEHYIEFSGSNNVFDLRGVTIEFDTKFRSLINTRSEFSFSGTGNTVKGLTIKNIGSAIPKDGGLAMTIGGENNTFRDITCYVSGSFPYGYGDLLGKGRNSIAPLRKTSGIKITGDKTTLNGVSVYMRALGHCIFIQSQPTDVLLKNCYVEGEMRSTDEMLEETSGLAYRKEFRTVWPPGKIQPGYVKSLVEDGYRSYGWPKNLEVVNCKAKNVRHGFALGTGDWKWRENMVTIRDSVAVGCEAGFLASSTIIENSRGDAKYGPLLYMRGGRGAKIDLSLMGDESEYKVHEVATICGIGHSVRISPWKNQTRETRIPIKLAHSTPPAGNAFSGTRTQMSENITLVNNTNMPIVIGQHSRSCQITTAGEVIENKGRNGQIESR